MRYYVKFDENKNLIAYTMADYYIQILYEVSATDYVKILKENNIPIPEELDFLKQAKKNKVDEIYKDCEAYIYNGVDIKYQNGLTEHFSYGLKDQNNISEMFTAVLSGANEFPYHADGELCKIYDKDQIVQIYGTLSLFKAEATTYHNSLKAQIENMTDIEQINNVKYHETELYGEYLSNYNKMIESARNQLNMILTRIPSSVKL